VATAANDAGLVAQTLQAAGFNFSHDVQKTSQAEEIVAKFRKIDVLMSLHESAGEAVGIRPLEGKALSKTLMSEGRQKQDHLRHHAKMNND